MSVTDHYALENNLVDTVLRHLRQAGQDIDDLQPADLAAIDEFHIRGRKATLELAAQMRLGENFHVLDIGSGLGGPARTLAEAYDCRVTGIDLSETYCEAARVFSSWVGLDQKVDFRQGDATSMPFENEFFDAAMTIHVAMNIAARDRMYHEAKRVLKADAIFAAYDVLQGEGGEVLYPVPWARKASISHLVTPADMEGLLIDAGFDLLEIDDSSDRSRAWFEKTALRLPTAAGPVPGLQLVLGDDFPEMVRNQVRNLQERRIRTVSYVCRA